MSQIVVKIKFYLHRKYFENHSVLLECKISFIINNNVCWPLLEPGLNLMNNICPTTPVV